MINFHLYEISYLLLFSYLFKQYKKLFQNIQTTQQTIKMLNIPSTVQDPKFRYRMPKMILKIQSKGNGIKTNIVNLNDVAKHLRTDAQYILKFFGFQKASQTTFKQAGGKNNTNYIINGDFNDGDMLKVLDRFIQKYICCPKCKLPEMHMIVINNVITGKCDSCPFTGVLDNKHRLTAYILKNPPIARNMATGKQQKKQKKTQLQHKMDQQHHHAKKGTKKQQTIEQKQPCAKQLFSSVTLEFGSEEVQKLIEYMKKYIEDRKDQDFDIKSAYIVSELKSLGLKKPLLAYIIFNTIFSVNIANQITEQAKLYLNLVKKLVVLNTELETLLNLEYLFLEVHKGDQKYKKFLPTIMMKLFDAGFFSSEFVSEWSSKEGLKDIEKAFMYNQERDQQFKTIVADFIEWATQQDSEQEQEKKQLKHEVVEQTQQEVKQEVNQEQTTQQEKVQNHETTGENITA